VRRKQGADEYSVRLGNAIRVMRIQTGLSQEMFAYSHGINRTYMTDIELGRRNITIGMGQRIADGLGMTLVQLLSMADAMEVEDGI
jgi:transcriptional regulator with XRE-family HTH domain